MRQIVLDTETTGLEHAQGHRIIEVAALEVSNRRVTDRYLHRYINPEREIDEGAQQVHGITLEFLQDKPRFEGIAQEFLDFVRGAELIIHNAPFDVGFLNAELARLDLGRIQDYCPVITDTLKMAKNMRPGQKNNLDALCRHYGIDNSSRTLHGALLDTELLAEVFLAMTRGQESLIMDLGAEEQQSEQAAFNPADLVVLAANAAETTEHEAYLDSLDKAAKGTCVWRANATGSSAEPV